MLEQLLMAQLALQNVDQNEMKSVMDKVYTRVTSLQSDNSNMAKGPVDANTLVSDVNSMVNEDVNYLNANTEVNALVTSQVNALKS